MMFYHEYFALPGDIVAREAERDLESWLTSAFYTLSADRPLPPELAGVDLTKLPEEMLYDFVRAVMSVPQSGTFNALLERPDKLPAWLGEDDLKHCLTEFEYSELAGPLNYYRNSELDWEILGQYQGKLINVPALFISGDRDIVTIWSQQAIAPATEMLTDLRGAIIIPNCGHWIQQEQPLAVNRELLAFL